MYTVSLLLSVNNTRDHKDKNFNNISVVYSSAIDKTQPLTLKKILCTSITEWKNYEESNDKITNHARVFPFGKISSSFLFVNVL